MPQISIADKQTQDKIYNHLKNYLVSVKPSDNVKIQNNAQKLINGSNFTLAKSILLPYPGAVRVTFEYLTTSTSYPFHYVLSAGRNQSGNQITYPIISTDSTVSNTYVSVSVDAQVQAYTELCLFVRSTNSSYGGQVRNFKVAYDFVELASVQEPIIIVS